MVRVLDEFIAKSVNDYINIVNEFKPKRAIFTGKPIKLFRGMDSRNYNYIPALGRAVDPMSERIPVAYEQKMIHKAKLKMPDLFKDDKLPIQAITKLQHYELPTRLLDFTSNSLVALFFACQSKTIDNHKQDGKIMVCLEQEKSIYDCYSPFVNAVADMNNILIDRFSRTKTGFLKSLTNKEYWSILKEDTQKYLREYESKNIVNIDHELRTRILEDIYNSFHSYDFSSPIFFESEQNSERIRRQQGLFLLFPNAKDDKGIYSKDRLCVWQPKLSREIIIPHGNKKTILKDLKDLGITKSYLFPEPEKICADIFDEIKVDMGG